MADDVIQLESGSDGEVLTLLGRMADLLEKIAKPVATPVPGGKDAGADSSGIKWFDALTDAATRFLLKAASPLTGMFDKLSAGTDAIGRFITKALSPLTITFDKISESVTKFIGKVSSPFVAMFDKLAAVAGTVQLAGDKFSNFQSKIAQFTQGIDPGSVNRMDYAMKDLMATIGVSLAPLFQALVPIVERFGDAIANIDFEPIIGPAVQLIDKLADAFFKVLDAAGPLIDALINILGKALEALIPIIEPLTQALVAIMPLLTSLVELLGGAFVAALELIQPIIVGLVKALQWMVDKITDMINYIIDMANELPGVDIAHVGGKADKPKLSEGPKTRATAGRGVSFDDIEGASKRASEASAKMGSGTDPAERTAKNTEGLNEQMKDMIKMVAEALKKDVEKGRNSAMAQAWREFRKDIPVFPGFFGDE